MKPHFEWEKNDEWWAFHPNAVPTHINPQEVKWYKNNGWVVYRRVVWDRFEEEIAE